MRTVSVMYVSELFANPFEVTLSVPVSHPSTYRSHTGAGTGIPLANISLEGFGLEKHLKTEKDAEATAK